jgi:hypothetical protein
MQYRAIGLVRGKYVPSEEQLSSGHLITAEGDRMEAILLGRVLSLVKNHLELGEEHLWVVYPRTQEVKSKKPRRATEEAPPPELRFQIVGIWEPETLHPLLEEDDSGLSGEEAPSEESKLLKPIRPTLPTSVPDTADRSIEDGYFSVRGEVIFYASDKNRLIVKIQQLNRKNPDQRRDFKVHLFGRIDQERVLHHFWDFQVQRQAGRLVIMAAECIGPMPPQRRKKVGGNRKPFRSGGASGGAGSNRPQRSAPGSPVPRPKPTLASPRPDLTP